MRDNNTYKYLYDELNNLYDDYSNFASALNLADNYLKNNIISSESIDKDVLNSCKNSLEEDMFKLKTYINECEKELEKGEENG